MADGVTVKPLGLKELRSQIANLAKALSPEKSEPVLYRGAEIIGDSARAKAAYNPRRKKGIHLRDAVIVKKLKRFGKEPAPSIAAVDRKKAPHAHLVEHGSGERVDKRGRKLGRMPARPFMRPAFDQNKRRVLEQVERELGQLIDEAVRKA
jgi:HK97 gp10 family phage protein